MGSLLQLNNVFISYGPIEVIKGISIEVPHGKIISLLGANGAGKSTLIKAIAGLVKPKSGSIIFDNEPINQLPIHTRAEKGIIMSPEGRLIFKELTVEDNLGVGAYSLKPIKQADGITLSVAQQKAANLARVFKYFPILQERRKQVASTLSGGEQQMLAIGRALMASPKLLLLDEPSLGLAPLIVKSIFEIIQAIAKEGTPILIVEQNAYQTLKITDYSYVLELGHIKAEGTREALLSDPRLLSAYLGSR